MNQKEFTIAIIITVLVILLWVVADIIHTRSTVTVDSRVQQLLSPLNPVIDTSILDQIPTPTQPIPSYHPPIIASASAEPVITAPTATLNTPPATSSAQPNTQLSIP